MHIYVSLDLQACPQCKHGWLVPKIVEMSKHVLFLHRHPPDMSNRNSKCRVASGFVQIPLFIAIAAFFTAQLQHSSSRQFDQGSAYGKLCERGHQPQLNQCPLDHIHVHGATTHHFVHHSLGSINVSIISLGTIVKIHVNGATTHNSVYHSLDSINFSIIFPCIL